jgi:hypothetical protein
VTPRAAATWSDNFLGLLRELFEGVDYVGISDIDTAYLIWRIEALTHMFDTIRGGPEKGATVDIVKQVKQLATGLADLKAAAGQSTVTLSDADRAEITQALAALVPTAGPADRRPHRRAPRQRLSG